MNPMFLFIIAIVLPTGEMDIKHTIVPKCPTKEEVSQVMKPMQEAGDILVWGGTCDPLVPAREASNG